MLSLDSPRWSKLEYAYGDGSMVPVILRALGQAGPPHLFKGLSQDENPWKAAWAGICHQGSVYTASFAAVPHLVAMCRQAKPEVLPHLVNLIAWIELGRSRDDAPGFPHGLKAPYFRALEDLRDTLSSAAGRKLDRNAACAIAGAFLVINGLHALGDFVLTAPIRRPSDPDSGEELFPDEAAG